MIFPFFTMPRWALWLALAALIFSAIFGLGWHQSAKHWQAKYDALSAEFAAYKITAEAKYKALNVEYSFFVDETRRVADENRRAADERARQDQQLFEKVKKDYANRIAAITRAHRLLPQQANIDNSASTFAENSGGTDDASAEPANTFAEKCRLDAIQLDSLQQLLIGYGAVIE